jgi:hypothetical protein
MKNIKRSHYDDCWVCGAESLCFSVVFHQAFVSFCPFPLGHCIICPFPLGHCIIGPFPLGHCIICPFPLGHCIICPFPGTKEKDK